MSRTTTTYEISLVTAEQIFNRVREKIEKDPSNPIYIQTVWGVGYRFKA